MLEVIDSFSRKRAESVELIRSAQTAHSITRQATDEISAWCTRDEIRHETREADTREYVLKSMLFVEQIGEKALARRERFIALARDGRVKREQLYSDACELREVDLLDSKDFEPIRELDVQLLMMQQWADEDEQIYEHAVACLEDLRERYRVFTSKDDARTEEPAPNPFDSHLTEVHGRFVIVSASRTIH